jgi:hypothetical protein
VVCRAKQFASHTPTTGFPVSHASAAAMAAVRVAVKGV